MVGRLLERERELTEIGRLVEAAREGSGNLVLVEGAAGIGKTRLVDEARLVATRASLRVLSARGVALEREFAFGVVRQLFERPVAAMSERERREVLSGPAALAQALVGVASGEHLRPVADTTFASLHGLYWLCFNLARGGPLLITLDDAHWADVPSLRFVHFLAARLDGLGVVLMVALRPDESDRTGGLLESVRGAPGARVLAPSELSETACEHMIREAFAAAAQPAFYRACSKATGGNPFYLRALIDGLLADRIAPTEENAKRVAAQVPDTVVRALVLRMSRLPQASVELARTLSVLGADAELGDAAALAGISLEDAQESADLLAGAGMITRRRPLRFVHPIVEAAVSADLSAGERSRRHAHAARILAARGAAAERVASHLLASEPTGDPWSREMLRAAAADALARAAPDSAVRYLARARDEDSPVEASARVLRELGVAEFLAGDQAGIEHLREARALTADPRLRAEIAQQLATGLTTADRFQESVAVLEQAIKELEGGDRILAQALEAQLLGASALHLSTRTAHREHLARVRADELGDSPTERQLLGNLALWRASEGERASVCQALAERSLGEGKLLEEVTSDSQVFYSAPTALLYCEAIDDARYWYDRALDDARARGSLFGFAIASAMRAECYYRMGDLREAEADAQAAIEAGGTNRWVLAPVAISALARVMIERGQLAEAETLLADWPVPFGLDQPGMANWIPYACGQLRLATGQWADAHDRFMAVGAWMQAWGERDPGLLDWRTGAALSLAQTGELDRARELTGEVTALARSLGKPGSLGVGLRAAGMIERGPEAIELLREAVAALAPTPARLEHARALIELGAALRRHNHRKEARGPLREGINLAQRCGATALAQRGRVELVASGARPRRVALSGLEALTPSERRVAQLAAEGLSTPAVAQQLFVTVNTVETHLRRTYLKLGIHSRDDLRQALTAPAVDARTTGSPTRAGGPAWPNQPSQRIKGAP